MNICAWTAVLRGDLKLSWGGMGVSPFPAELYQRGEGAQLFLFPLVLYYLSTKEFSRSWISLW